MVRSVVYDSNNGLVLWKSENNHSIRWIDLNKIDFSANTLTLMVDANINREGEINDHLIKYNLELLRELLSNKFNNTDEETIMLLTERGYSLKEVLENIILHPTKNNSPIN